MEPYYNHDGITIYCGDSREVLPQLSLADLVLTDPPYGMQFQSKYRQERHKVIHGDDTLPLDLIWLSIMKARAAAYVFCRWDNLSSMPVPKSVLAWVKNNWSMGDLKHEHGRQWEACCFYPKPKHEFVTRIPDVIKADRTDNNLHPTEKPVAAMERIISANVCDDVLDPFMGSGTTLLAAKLCGKRAVGIEIDESYCEAAANRLAQGVLF